MKFYYSGIDEILHNSIIQLNEGFRDNDMYKIDQICIRLATYFRIDLFEIVFFINGLNRYILRDKERNINILTELKWKNEGKRKIELIRKEVSPLLIEDYEFQYLLNEWMLYMNIKKLYILNSKEFYGVDDRSIEKEVKMKIDNDIIRYGDSSKNLIVMGHCSPVYPYFKESITNMM